MISLCILHRTIFILIFLCPTSSQTQANRLIMLIDENNDEALYQNEVKALVSIFNKTIYDQVAPILVSRNILYNYIARRSYTTHPSHPENKDLVNSPLYKGIWRLFKINNAKFYLLLPEKLLPTTPYPTNLAGRQILGFHFTNTTELTSQLPFAGDFYRDIRNFLKRDTQGLTLEQIDLSILFNTKRPSASVGYQINYTPWNIYLFGHGSSTGSIAGTQAKNVCKLLNFFDSNISTNLVYITSCFLGGANKYLLMPPEQKAYNFILALGAITDAITVIHSAKISFKQFFTQAEKPLKSRDKSYLIDTLKPLTQYITSKWSHHGITEQPQIYSPQRKCFEVLAFDKSIIALHHTNRPIPSPAVMHKSLAQKVVNPGDTATPATIFLHDKIAILLYDSFYEETLHITPNQAGTGVTTSKANPLTNIPTVAGLLMPSLLGLDRAKEKTPAWSRAARDMQAVLQKSTDNSRRLFSRMKKCFSPSDGIFPAFISMLHTPHSKAGPITPQTISHHFTQIDVSNKLNGVVNPLFGVMHFFRDAFLDASCRCSKNIFLIDSLTGFNDFSIYFELEALAEEKPLAPFARELTEYIHEHITFSQITISTQGLLGNSQREMCVEISFIFNEKAWSMQFIGKPEDFSQINHWQFDPIDDTTYQELYDSKKTNILNSSSKNPPKTYADAVRQGIATPTHIRFK